MRRKLLITRLRRYALPVTIVIASAALFLLMLTPPRDSSHDWLVRTWYVEGNCQNAYDITEAPEALRITHRGETREFSIAYDLTSASRVTTDAYIFDRDGDMVEVKARVDGRLEFRLKPCEY